MKRFPASLIVMSIEDSHPQLHPQLQVIGNGEYTIKIDHDEGPYFIWSVEEWILFKLKLALDSQDFSRTKNSQKVKMAS